MNKNKKLMYSVVVLVVVIGLFMWLKPAKAPTQTSQEVNGGVVTPQIRTFALTVAGGKIIGTSNVLTVGSGDRVTLKVTSDVTDTLQLAGYNLDTDLTAGKSGGITFTANQTGRFIISFAKAKIDLGTLEVLPR